ncbi:pectate lyase [Asticcacaulis sp. BYS171W]|uniref:Pectate lyase n=1 Tax=Asticcacaulis aquaticus TaxID=2984212 RepID=A0ABT5HX26_9CAUL|nr:pectate lyase [Asticcacaulis aquaticus]MDC7684627.1 pectate lyase [Asticcacaulis aquaticus]
MSHLSLSRRHLLSSAAALAAFAATPVLAQTTPADPAAIKTAMRKAARYMVDKVSHEGGYVWQTLPDRSREWGEIEAYRSSVWIQNPGTPLVGQLYLDAYHATGDEYFYQAAAKAADVLIRGQLPSGGWNYLFDLKGEASLKKWYDTIGKNAWRLEEFQHYYGNGTFDDSCTSDVAKFMLRIYLEKKNARYKASLDKVIKFVLDSQYPVGGWPQRFPLRDEFHHHGRPDYTSLITFNDDVSAENIEFLIMVWQTLGDKRVLDPIARGMDCFAKAQQPKPQAGWGLQHTVADLKPTGARTYEPPAMVSHTTQGNCQLMMDFYELTGDAKFMARLPEAFDWLESIRLPEAFDPQKRYPTFIEIGTGKPLFIHRKGSNVVNGEYYANGDINRTIAHYSSFRGINPAALRKRYDALMKVDPAELTKTSPLKGGRKPLPRYFTFKEVGFEDLRTDAVQTVKPSTSDEVSKVLSTVDADGIWLTPLKSTSYRYTRDSTDAPAPGDYATTHVGDVTDTSAFNDPKPSLGISTAVFVANMGTLIRGLPTVAKG